jgi:Caspase domain
MRAPLFVPLLFAAFLASAPAHAEKRVALVIGMSNYQQVPRLPNPTRDASATANLFRKAGFDLVKDERDQGIADLRRACDFRSGSRLCENIHARRTRRIVFCLFSF